MFCSVESSHKCSVHFENSQKVYAFRTETGFHFYFVFKKILYAYRNINNNNNNNNNNTTSFPNY